MTVTKVIILSVNGEIPAFYIHDDADEFRLFIDEWGKIYNNIYEFQFVSGTPILKL